MKKLFSEIHDSEGERILLKCVEEEDAPELSEMTRDPQVYRYLPAF